MAGAMKVNQREAAGMHPQLHLELAWAHIAKRRREAERHARIRQHRHPYAEVFVVQAGQGRLEIDENRLTAISGDILIAPAMRAHRFTHIEGAPLRITAIHTAQNIDIESLQPTTGPGGTAC